MGGGGNLLDPFPEKPKNMHWTKYRRLREKAEQTLFLSLFLAVQRLGGTFADEL
jgi:hypothetical protein